MKRHVLVGRFGPADNARVPAAPDETSTRLDLVASNRMLAHGVGQALLDLAKLGVLPTEAGIDFAILAAHVHAADTRILRRTDSQDSWTREIRVVVPVSDPARWSANAQRLSRTLNFLTGDQWTVGFRSRPAAFASLRPSLPRGASEPNYASVALFSGGLDSLIGAIDLIEGGESSLFVSHAGDGAASAAQHGCFDGLAKHYAKQAPDRLRVWMAFPNDLVHGTGPENTTRGRSFLFFALGALAGSGLGTRFTLHVPENGLIALNVPLDPLRLGSLSTRTTHPFYMARWNELLNGIGLPGIVENPYWNKTKGEMVANCTNRGLLRQLVPVSMSCSSPTKARWRGHATEHCGYCMPCLIRRAALLAGLGRPDPTTYSIPNLAARPLKTNASEGEHVRSFQVAIQRLRARPVLARILIHKPGSLRDESPARKAELAGIYHRGMEEVGALLRGVRTTSA